MTQTYVWCSIDLEQLFRTYVWGDSMKRKKRYKIVNKKRFYTFLLISALLVSFVIDNILKLGTAYGNYLNQTYVSYVVKPGDTLWNISSDFLKDGEDKRDLIYQIRQANNISAEIFPGDEIMIPTP